MTDIAKSNTLARSLHDAGLAAWFGGSLFGVLGLNAATADLRDPRERTRAANAAWGRWTPYNLAAIIAHLAGGLQLTQANKARMATQRGVAGTSNLKLVLTLAALGATGYARTLGQAVMKAEAEPSTAPAGEQPSEDATTPAATAPPEAKKAQSQLRYVQWSIPLLTGALIVLQAAMGEQQRPAQVARGVFARLSPTR